MAARRLKKLAEQSDTRPAMWPLKSVMALGDVTREIGHGTRDAVRGVGGGTLEATKAPAEEVKKVVKPAPAPSEY